VETTVKKKEKQFLCFLMVSGGKNGQKLAFFEGKDDISTDFRLISLLKTSKKP